VLCECCRLNSLLILINVRENGREIKNGQHRDTGNIEHKTQNKDKQNTKT
jgi:hypothetical protein